MYVVDDGRLDCPIAEAAALEGVVLERRDGTQLNERGGCRGLEKRIGRVPHGDGGFQIHVVADVPALRRARNPAERAGARHGDVDAPHLRRGFLHPCRNRIVVAAIDDRPIHFAVCPQRFDGILDSVAQQRIAMDVGIRGIGVAAPRAPSTDTHGRAFVQEPLRDCARDAAAGGADDNFLAGQF